MEALFEATEAEHLALFRMLAQAKDILDRHHQPDGYNIGINHGQAGGQSVPHLHIHLIPRYRGDKEDARGGVRWVIFIIGMDVQPKTANDRLNSNNERFYDSRQGLCETRWIEFGLVGIHRPSGAGDASGQDDEGRRAGQALCPVMLVERFPGLRLNSRHRG